MAKGMDVGDGEKGDRVAKVRLTEYDLPIVENQQRGQANAFIGQWSSQ
jgi:hypothetical protein